MLYGEKLRRVKPSLALQNPNWELKRVVQSRTIKIIDKYIISKRWVKENPLLDVRGNSDEI